MPNTRTYRRCLPAFTLIELLVVIAIIGVLVSMLLPALRGAKTEALKAACKSTMHQLALGTTAYRVDYRDYFFLTRRLGPGIGGYMPFGLSYNTPYSPDLETYFAKGTRYCPSLNKFPEATGTYDSDLPKRSFQWTYCSPLLESPDGAAGAAAGVSPISAMEDRVYPAGVARAYVRLTPGPMIYNGSTYVFAGLRSDPLAGLPIFADNLASCVQVPPGTLRVAPHNTGGDPITDVTQIIDSQGGNSLWDDAHVEWHEWPAAARSTADQSGAGIFGNPDPILLYAPGAVEEGWCRSTTEFLPYFFWVKPTGRP